MGGFYQYVVKRTRPSGRFIIFSSPACPTLVSELRVNLERVPGYSSRVPSVEFLCKRKSVCSQKYACSLCVAAIVSCTTFPGCFQLSRLKFIGRSALLHTTLAVKLFSQSHGRGRGWVGGGGVCVCEGNRGGFHPDPGRSPVEPAENGKHLLERRIALIAQAAKAAGFSVDRTQILTFLIIKLSLT